MPLSVAGFYPGHGEKYNDAVDILCSMDVPIDIHDAAESFKAIMTIDKEGASGRNHRRWIVRLSAPDPKNPNAVFEDEYGNTIKNGNIEILVLSIDSSVGTGYKTPVVSIISELYNDHPRPNNNAATKLTAFVKANLGSIELAALQYIGETRHIRRPLYHAYKCIDRQEMDVVLSAAQVAAAEATEDAVVQTLAAEDAAAEDAAAAATAAAAQATKDAAADGVTYCVKAITQVLPLSLLAKRVAQGQPEEEYRKYFDHAGLQTQSRK